MKIIGIIICNERSPNIEPHLIKRVIKSIRGQTRPPDFLYLSFIKVRSKKSLENLDRKFSVEGVLDHPLQILNDPYEKGDKDIFIFFNCEKKMVVYNEDIVEKLLRKIRENPGVAIGSSGLKIGRFPFYFSICFNEYWKNKFWYCFNPGAKGEEVDILFSYSASAYTRDMFKDFEDFILFSLKYTSISLDFDYIISLYMNINKVNQYIYRMPPVKEVVRGNFPDTSSFVYHQAKNILRFFQKPLAPFSIFRTYTYIYVVIALVVILSVIWIFLYDKIIFV